MSQVPQVAEKKPVQVDFDNPKQAYNMLIGKAHQLIEKAEQVQPNDLAQGMALLMLALAGQIKRTDKDADRIVVPKVM
jgi:hypothetical protein